MKKYIYMFALALSAFATSACTEDKIEVFGEENYLHFKQESKKEYRFSFATMPDKDEYTFEVPMTLIGSALTEDKEYVIEVVKEGDLVTTASADSYELPASPVFHKGLFEDVLPIHFNKTADLEEEKVLVLKVVENENFKKGPVAYQIAKIYFSNIITQPKWWDEAMSKAYLGPYSQIKYQHFILATGKIDLDPKNQAEVVAYVTDFIYYLRKLDDEGKTVYESDGKTKVLDTISYAKHV